MVLPSDEENVSVVATPNLNCLGARLSHSIAIVAQLSERVAAPETMAGQIGIQSSIMAYVHSMTYILLVLW